LTLNNAMPKAMTRLRSPWLAGSNALVSSLWVAVCAATPEFIWRGARIVASHFSWTDVVSALLVGVILAFCIEPAMERLRHRLSSGTHKTTAHAQAPLAVAGLAFAFAIASVCLHETITAFLSAHQEASAANAIGLVAGIRMALGWAAVPFSISVAWVAAPHRRIAIPLGVFAGASPLLTGWLFSWASMDTIATEIPTLAILLWGYRVVAQGPREDGFRRCARSMAWLVPIWFAAALTLDAGINALGFKGFHLYTASEAWIDARFYFGWVIGLMLAPFPFRRLTADNGK
jgi:hypothetical protein